MKKYISLIAVLALLVACMVATVSAAGMEAIIDSKTVEMGEGTVDVVLEVKTGEKGIAGGEFTGLTVSEGATIKSVTSAGVIAVYNPANGMIAFFNAAGTDVNGTLFTITVTVPVDAPATYEVSFTGNTVAKGAETAEEACAISGGVITVAHECVAGEWEVVEEPTCTEAGLKVQKCALCGKIMAEEEIPALGHTEEIIPAVAATCTETGLTEGKKCSVCGEILVAQEEVAALGHDWKDAGIANEGDYDCADEKMNQACSRCDATQVVDHAHDCEIIEFVIGNRYDEEQKANITTKQYKCKHSVSAANGGHGCSVYKGDPWDEVVVDPVTGDITPYIAMGVLTMVALISAAAYMLLKRKAV